MLSLLLSEKYRNDCRAKLTSDKNKLQPARKEDSDPKVSNPQWPSTVSPRFRFIFFGLLPCWSSVINKRAHRGMALLVGRIFHSICQPLLS